MMEMAQVQPRLLDALRGWLVDGDQRLTVQLWALGEVRMQGSFLAIDAQGAEVRAASRLPSPDQQIDEFFELMIEHRAAAYIPLSGTWFNITLVLEPGKGLQINLDFDHQPAGLGTVENLQELCLEELRVYPRSPENTPEWLSAGAAGDAPQQ